jgi:hypothetical protein
MVMGTDFAVIKWGRIVTVIHCVHGGMFRILDGQVFPRESVRFLPLNNSQPSVTITGGLI